MDIIKRYYDKVYSLINQVEIPKENLCYLTLQIYKSLKSVYICAMNASETISKMCISHNSESVCYLTEIIKGSQSNKYLRDNIRQSVLCSFIDSLDMAFKEFSLGSPESITIIDNSCSLFKKICTAQKANSKESDYWEETEFEKIILDTSYAKEALVDLYLVLSLFVVYCIKSNEKVYSILTSSQEPTEKDISVASEFYQRGDWHKIQFFLPIETDVTLSYFMYRYIFPSNISDKIGALWSMGNKKMKTIPLSEAQIIMLVNEKKIPSDKMSSQYTTFKSRVNKLCEIGIFDTNNVDSEEKIKILFLSNFMKTAHWDMGIMDTVNMDILKLLSKPNSKYFKEFDTHVLTRENLVGTIFLSEIMKEISLCDIYLYTQMSLNIEINLKLIRKNLEECFKNNFYDVRLREKINSAIEFGFEIDTRKRLIIEIHPIKNPILRLFLKCQLNKIKSLIDELVKSMKNVDDRYESLIISVFPKWDEDPQQQKKEVVFCNVTPENFIELVKNIDISFKNISIAEKELSKVDTFFRLYFPEKAFIEEKCTEREYLSVYELINAVKGSDLSNDVKSAFAAKTTPRIVNTVRELAISKIENHNMSGNYNGMFIPTFINIMIFLARLFNAIDDSSSDKLKLNRLYHFSNQDNKCIMELGKYLFGRNIDGLRYSDIDKSKRDVEIDPEWQEIFEDYFSPYFKNVIQFNCDICGVS